MSCFDARFINFITKHSKTDQVHRVEACIDLKMIQKR